MNRFSLPLIVSLLGVAIFHFPGGVIAMKAACGDGDVDHWDWLFSVAVPFYGIAEALVC